MLETDTHLPAREQSEPLAGPSVVAQHSVMDYISRRGGLYSGRKESQEEKTSGGVSRLFTMNSSFITAYIQTHIPLWTNIVLNQLTSTHDNDSNILKQCLKKKKSA